MTELLPPLIGIRPHVVLPSAGTHVRSIPLLLRTGDSIIGGSVSLTAVDKDTNLPLVGDTLVLDELGAALSSSAARGDIWMVNFSPLLGSPIMYTLRLDFTLASQPDKPQEPLFYRLQAVKTYH